MCCCLPPKCLKLFIFIACILILGIGAVLIWGGYQLLILSVLKSFGYSFIGYIVIACGAVLILIGFLGFIGSWKQQKFLLAIFIIFGFIIGLFLIGIGAAAIYSRGVIDDYLSSETKCAENYKSVENAYEYAEDIMCKLYCPCKAKNEYIDSLAQSAADESQENQYYVYTHQGAKTILDCDPCFEMEKTISEDTKNTIIEWIEQNLGIKVTENTCSVTSSEFKDKYFTSSMRTYLPLIEWIEDQFDCSGLCIVRSVYLFSDVNNGEPSGSCRKEFNDWVQKNFQIVGIVGIIFGTYILLTILFSCTLCCCQRKKKVEDDDPNAPRKRP